jgi:hypothetical protein
MTGRSGSVCLRTLLLGALLCCVALGTARAACDPPSARECDPVPHPWIPGAVVGCCAPDCTLIPAGTGTAAECVNEANTCQQGHCQDVGGVRTCAANTNGNWQPVEGNPTCLHHDGTSGDQCAIGECRQQNCDAISDGTSAPDAYEDRCASPDRNPTYDFTECRENYCNRTGSGANDFECLVRNRPVDFNCSTASGNTCTIKACDANGDCKPPTSGPLTKTCTGNLPECKEWQCDAATSGCTAVPVPPDTSCDDVNFDCKVKRCNGVAKCKIEYLPVHAQCDDPSDCRTGRCTTTHACENIVINSALNGEPCTDANNCTTGTTCDFNGNCGHNTGCLTGNHCLLCGDNSCADTGPDSTCGCP